MNWKIFILFLLVAHFDFSQNEIGSLYEEMPNDSILPNSLNIHTGVKPLQVANRIQHSEQSKHKKYDFAQVISS